MVSNFLASAEELIEEARNGRMFIMVDDEDRENEGDLIIPAQMATPDAVNFMAKNGRGLICLALSPEKVRQLGLPQMTEQNGTVHSTAFTVSIEAKHGVSTGISARDRALTISVAINAENGADSLVSPGHVFPLAARNGGVLVRAGHTEAAVDISRLAGLNPSAVICEIMKDDGTMARLDDLVAFAQRHGFKIGTIRDLIAYRRRHDSLVHCVEQQKLQSDFGGDWTVKTYLNKLQGDEHMVLQKGTVDPARPTLVRMHTASLFADMLGENGPRTGKLKRAMEMIGAAGSGVIVILRESARHPLTQLVRREGSKENFEIRDYGIGAQILVDLGVCDIELLSDAHHNYVGLEGYGLDIIGERAFDGSSSLDVTSSNKAA